MTESVVTFGGGDVIMSSQKRGGYIMTFGEKLKKLRNDNQLTQDELAERIYVTRTAVSKWETDKGYPSIDSLKQLSGLFHISIDELISDTDTQNKRLLGEARGRKFYWFAIACLAVATISAVINCFLKMTYLSIISFSGVIGYIVLGLLSKPKYKRIAARKMVLPYVLSRLVILAVIVAVIVYAFIEG